MMKTEEEIEDMISILEKDAGHEIYDAQINALKWVLGKEIMVCVLTENTLR